MSAHTPRVSVLIPTYNRAALLCGAIDSVLAQTYDDHEIIVVDDGSTDDTKDVVQRYAGRIDYVSCAHGGPAKARNVGLRRARGEFLCILDSDDLYYPHKLALQVDYLDRHRDAVMVYTEFSAFDEAGFHDEFHLRTYHQSAYRSPLCAYDSLFAERASLADNRFVCEAAERFGKPHWTQRYQYRGYIFDAYLFNTIVFTNSMMFRRSVLGRTGLQQPYFGHFHDLEFALRICKTGIVGFIDNPTYKLRYHPGQISTTRKPEGERNAGKLQRGLLRVARKHAVEDADYYARNRRRVDQLIARLCRAAAVPLIAYGGSSAHGRRYFPRRARRYLRRSARHGHPAPDLYLVSYLPALAKRLYFGLWDRWRRRAHASSRLPT